MEKLYEEYIANKLKKTKSMFTLVNTQHNKYSLFNMKNDKKVNVYKIKPDIVTTSNDNDEVIIIDTKWKILKSPWAKSSGSISNVCILYEI